VLAGCGSAVVVDDDYTTETTTEVYTTAEEETTTLPEVVVREFSWEEVDLTSAQGAQLHAWLLDNTTWDPEPTPLPEFDLPGMSVLTRFDLYLRNDATGEETLIAEGMHWEGFEIGRLVRQVFEQRFVWHTYDTGHRPAGAIFDTQRMVNMPLRFPEGTTSVTYAGEINGVHYFINTHCRMDGFIGKMHVFALDLREHDLHTATEIYVSNNLLASVPQRYETEHILASLSPCGRFYAMYGFELDPYWQSSRALFVFDLANGQLLGEIPVENLPQDTFRMIFQDEHTLVLYCMQWWSEDNFLTPPAYELHPIALQINLP